MGRLLWPKLVFGLYQCGKNIFFFLTLQITDDKLFEQGIDQGINFDKFDNIPVIVLFFKMTLCLASIFPKVKAEKLVVYPRLLKRVLFFFSFPQKFSEKYIFIKFIFLWLKGNVIKTKCYKLDFRWNVEATMLQNQYLLLKTWVYDKFSWIISKNLDIKSQLRSKKLLFHASWLAVIWWLVRKLDQEKPLPSCFRKYIFLPMFKIRWSLLWCELE